MSLIERAKNILLSPRAEWEKIAGEPASMSALYRGYILPLSAIGPICGFIGLTLVGVTLPLGGTYRMPLRAGIVAAIVTYALWLIAVYIVALVTDALAPTFSGEKNRMRALKVAAYAFTPGWVAGVFRIVPMLKILTLIASLYALYLLYLGLPVLMKSPREKAAGYTTLVVISAVIVWVIIGLLTLVLGLGGQPPIRVGSPGSMLDPPGLPAAHRLV